MAGVKDTIGATNYVLQGAISAYSDEAYTNARKLSGTGIVGGNDLIDTNTETYTGTLRWRQPLNPTINVVDLTSDSDGSFTTTDTEQLEYIKSLRTHGSQVANMQQVITQEDGLAKIGRDFGETRAQDEHNAILSVLKGVAYSEALKGTTTGNTGGQTFTTDPTAATQGFYVDMGDDRLISLPGYEPHVTSPTLNPAYVGAQRAEALLTAMTMAWKDYEPAYAYLIATPEIVSSLRSANLVDTTKITEGNLTFDTIFQGKLRIIQSRADQSLDITKLNTGGGTDIAGTKTSFIVLPGAIAMKALAIPMPVEVDRTAISYDGSGKHSVWYRWGYVLAPAGYSWAGPKNFASNANYSNVYEDGSVDDWVAGSAITAADDCSGAWTRKFQSALSLGILPVFHK